MLILIWEELNVETPSNPEIDFPAPIVGFTLALTSGAYPRPPVDATDITTPPLGIWFWLTSSSEMMISLDPDLVIPVNVTLEIPVISSALKE